MKEINLKQVATELSTFSELTIDRQKVDTDYIIKNHVDGITIIGFDIVETKTERYPIIVFKEEPDKFFFGGMLFTQLFDAFCEQSGGTVAEVSDYMEKIGGLKVKLEKTRTKSGNNITKFTVL